MAGAYPGEALIIIFSAILALHPTIPNFIKKITTFIERSVKDWGQSSGLSRRRADETTNYFNGTARVLADRLLTNRCMVSDFLKIIGVSRSEISAHLHVAVDSQHLFDDLTSTSSRFDLLGITLPQPDVNIRAEPQVEAEPRRDNDEPQPDMNTRAERQLAEVKPGRDNDEPQPDTNTRAEPQLEAEPERDNAGGEHNFYANEIILMDEPTEAPWINESTRGMVFDDTEAEDGAIPCSACCYNLPKVAFCPCGHKCLCLECKYKLEKQTRRQNAHHESFSFTEKKILF